MDPLIGAALIKTGGDLLSGLFAPSPKKKLKWQRESEQKQMAWKAGQITNTLKPQTPYYQSGNLPQLGDASMRAVMGNLAQRMGPEMLAKWGINPAVQPPTAATPAPQTVVPPVGPMARRPLGFPGQDILMKRYLPQGA